jgi:hypothetical protein
MLNWLHNRGQLKKVPTNIVLMTPNSQTQIPLNDLNKMIADQKGITVDELAVNDGKQSDKSTQKTKDAVVETQIVVPEITAAPAIEAPVTASDLRSMADKLFKEAQTLRKKADELEPPKAKAKTSKATVAE